MRTRERLHGFAAGHTRGYSERRRISFYGNSFHCVVVAYLLAFWASSVGYTRVVPTVGQLWNAAGFCDYGVPNSTLVDGDQSYAIASDGRAERGELLCGSLCPVDPGMHRSGLGDDRITVVTQPDAYQGSRSVDQILHLIQDEETVAELHQLVLPPDEYYDKLLLEWRQWWPLADPALLEHLMSVCIAFDTATAFAMSFGISKFSLA